MAPGVGNAADLLNAALHAAKGNYKQAAWSLAGAVPLVGQGVTTAKAGKIGSKLLKGSKRGISKKKFGAVKKMLGGKKSHLKLSSTIKKFKGGAKRIINKASKTVEKIQDGAKTIVDKGKKVIANKASRTVKKVLDGSKTKVNKAKETLKNAGKILDRSVKKLASSKAVQGASKFIKSEKV